MIRATSQGCHSFLRVRPKSIIAFSLIEVVIALGIFSFAAVAILGLFAVGLKSSKESEGEIQAASTASMLIEVRKAAPTAGLGNFAISTNALTQAYGPAYTGNATNYIGLDGQITNSTAAAYRITCQAGTNAMTGPGVSQIYLMLSWPPQAAVNADNAGRYELITQIPNR